MTDEAPTPPPGCPDNKGQENKGVVIIRYVIYILLAGFLIYIINYAMSQGTTQDTNFCGPGQKYYALELTYYMDVGGINGTHKILQQVNCMTYRGINDSSSIYSINDTALFEIFNAISQDRCKQATATFKNQISCRIYNGTDWNETIYPYEGG